MLNMNMKSGDLRFQRLSEVSAKYINQTFECFSSKVNKFRIHNQRKLHSFGKRTLRSSRNDDRLPSIRWKSQGDASPKEKRRSNRMDYERRTAFRTRTFDGRTQTLFAFARCINLNPSH